MKAEPLRGTGEVSGEVRTWFRWGWFAVQTGRSLVNDGSGRNAVVRVLAILGRRTSFHLNLIRTLD